MSWEQPKTNWESTDFFNFTDFNRIKNNVLYLSEEINAYLKPVSIEEMQEDVTSYAYIWRCDDFNSIENNMNILCRSVGETFDAKRYFPNGPFIKWDELNRLEEACERIYKLIQSNKNCLPRFDMRLCDVQLGNKE